MQYEEEVDAGANRFSTAVRIAAVFRIAAVLTLVGGVLATVAGAINLGQQTDALGTHLNSGSSIVGFAVGGILASLVGAAFFAFFAYVLEILVGLYTQTRRLRIAMEHVQPPAVERSST
jgi:hypothetical protein